MRHRCFGAVALLLAVPALALADPFSEFRIPDHSWRSGTSQFGAWAYRSRASGGSSLSTNRSANTQFRAALEVGRDSDRLSRSFSVGASGGLAGSHRESGYDSGYSRNDERTGSSYRTLELSGSQRRYFGPSAWAVGGSASFRAEFSQYWDRDDIHESNSSFRAISRDFFGDDFYRYVGSTALTLGYGHVRDATVVMDVHVLEERLIALGTITGPLSPETRARLAGVLLAGGAIDAAHERPDRFYWREVERVLHEGGALGPAGFDGYAVMRAREPYALRGLSRRRGAYAGLLVEGLHYHTVDRHRDEHEVKYLLGDSLLASYRDDFGGRSSIGFDDVFGGVQGEFHLPVGWRWQFDVSGAASAPISAEDHGLRTATGLSADWIVADRWRAGAYFASSRTYLRHGDDPAPYVRDGWSTQVAALVSYFVEDHLTLEAQLSSRQEVRNLRLTRYYNLDHLFTLGLTYRFLGRFDAPGLMKPMRPLP